jgi:hypothetical protein
MKTCPLCKRFGARLVLERHHLRTRKADKGLTDLICRECHKTIHGLFSHQELRDPTLELDTREGLRSNERFGKALKHIKRVPPGAFMKMKQANRR